MSASASTERLSRLLAMVPYLLTHQGIPLAEASEHFGISENDLVHDLELLFVCGTPGHMPDDLIDARWDSGRIYLSNADPIARPARLAVDQRKLRAAGHPGRGAGFGGLDTCRSVAEDPAPGRAELRQRQRVRTRAGAQQEDGGLRRAQHLAHGFAGAAGQVVAAIGRGRALVRVDQRLHDARVDAG